jgi:hypothetical protein
LGILVWEQNSRTVGASVCDDERNRERKVFEATSGIANGNLDYELAGGSGGGQSGIVVGFGDSGLDNSGGKGIGVWVGVDESVFGSVASGVGVFVCKVSTGTTVSGFGRVCD